MMQSYLQPHLHHNFDHKPSHLLKMKKTYVWLFVMEALNVIL